MGIKWLLSIFLSMLLVHQSFAQESREDSIWSKAKREGDINAMKNLPLRVSHSPHKRYRPSPNNRVVRAATSSCACWQVPDSTWHVVPFDSTGGDGGPGTPPLYQNDDWSTGNIAFPFSFCLYGQTWHGVYINNNGNVTFGNPNPIYSADTFPNTNFVTIAPFWADVDTRDSTSGVAYYKITPTHIIIQWDSVGYYNQDSIATKRNSFQLILTNGSDPLLPGGNVSFCYGAMQWTTGDASNGVGGFGGFPAVVGINKGDGVNFVQLGTFNAPGTTYNGSHGAASGVGFLANNSFVLDGCSASSNIPPILTGFENCDTLHICEGDTLHINPSFFSPSVNLITSIAVNSTGINGYSIVSNTSGNTANLISIFAGQANNVGYNTILITASNNGTPPASTPLNIVIQVSPRPVITLSNDTTICDHAAPLLATGGSSYSWSPALGLSCSACPNPFARPLVTTTYTVTITKGCSVTASVTITAPPLVTISTPTSICKGDSTVLQSTGGGTYSWLPVTGLSATASASTIAKPTQTTLYYANVTNGSCTQKDSVLVTVVFVTAVANPDTTICPGKSAQLHAGGGTSYVWTPASTLSNGFISNPLATPSSNTTYTVTAKNALGCTSTATTTVLMAPVPVAGFDYQFSPASNGMSYQFINTSTGGTNSEWTFGDGTNSPVPNAMHSYKDTGTYRVCLIELNGPGCLDSTCKEIDVKLFPQILVPNIFTPNGDGKNDLFVFKNLENFPNSSLLIYDRWGVKVFENSNYQNNWNGKFLSTNRDVVDGTYYYILSGTNLPKVYTGFVQVSRDE